MNRLQSLDADRDYLRLAEHDRGDRPGRRSSARSTTRTRSSRRRAWPPSVAGRRSPGRRRTHYCGAYWRWGFHEDGVWSALRVAERLGGRGPLAAAGRPRGSMRSSPEPVAERAGGGCMTASAVYEGWVAHRRIRRGPPLLPLPGLHAAVRSRRASWLLDRIPLWSARRPAPARFPRGDYLRGDGDPLADARPEPRRTPASAADRRGPCGCWPTRATSASASTLSRSSSSMPETGDSTA